MSSNPVEHLRRSLAFRLGVWFALVFTASALALFLGLYWVLGRALEDRERRFLEGRLDRFASAYTAGGVARLQQVVRLEQAAPDQTALFVRLIREGKEVTFAQVPDDWVEFRRVDVPVLDGWATWQREERVVRIPRDARRDFALASRELPDGAVLQVGRSTDNREVLFEPLRRGFLVLGAAVLAVAFAGGVVFAYRATHPLRQIVATARGIIRTGDLDARVPVPRADDELAELVGLFNGTLERNQSLIRAMRESLDNAAHDLRTPLTRLRGTAELALTPGTPPAQAREALADCVEESERVLDILNTLLDITEAEAGMMRLRRQPTDLCRLLREVQEVYEFVAEERGVTVDLRLPAPCPVAVDPHRIRQVFANLLDNALKYTPRGGRVTVTAALADGSARVGFVDTGEGIPAGELPRIWTRLYRGDKSRSQRGLGLGLSLVKAVVEAHGGTVGVRSEPGHGSEFTVTLPATTPAEPAPA